MNSLRQRLQNIDLRKWFFQLSESTKTLMILGIAPLPLLGLIIHFFTRLNTLESLQEEVDRIQKKSIHLEALNQKENRFLASIKNPDHFYIDTYIETLYFLEPEIKKLESLLKDNPQDDHIRKRLHFLKDGNNRLRFAEVQTRKHQQFQEVEEQQQQVVEVNEEDLKKTLSLIEGVTIWPYGPREKRPQLIIKDFQLSKKENGSQDFVFLLNINLIKREFSNFGESS